jgi:mRNA interferase RelE/StbE
LWRYRVGDYRLICEIQDDRLLILVVKIGHGRDVYRF